jgi:type III secretion protein D
MSNAAASSVQHDLAMKPGLEFRVLTGTHEKATCDVTHAALVGSVQDCDIVLSDDCIPPHAARLGIDAAGWNLLAADGDATVAAPLGFNQAARVGTVWITVARPGDPWPDIPVLADGENASQVSHTTDADLGSRAGGAVAPLPLPVPADERRRGSAWPIVLGILTLTVSVTAGAMFLATPAVPAPTAPDPRQAPAQAALDRVRGAIGNLKLDARLSVDLADDYTVTITGWVADDTEQDRLAGALAGIWPLPALRVSNGKRVAQQAAALLENTGGTYRPEYQAHGRLLLKGIATDAQTRTAVLRVLRERLGANPIYEDDILLQEQAYAALQQALRAADLPDLPLTWQMNRLQVAADTLDDERLPRLKEAIADFNRTHLEVATLKSVPATSYQVSTQIPFVIRSVVGGPQPCLMLEDGTRLLVGGRYGPYRLKAIEAKRIVFDAPRHTVIPR